MVTYFSPKKENTWKSINLQKVSLSLIWILFKTVKKCITISDEKVILQEKDHKKHQKLWPLPWSNFTLSLYYTTSPILIGYISQPTRFHTSILLVVLSLSHCGVRCKGEVTSGCVDAQLRGGAYPPQEYRPTAESPFQHCVVEISLIYSSERKIHLQFFLDKKNHRFRT